MKTSLHISKKYPAGIFHLYGKGLLAGLIFLLLYFLHPASPLFAGPSPVVRIILVNTQTEAENIIAEVASGRSFAALAKERSIDKKSRDHFGEVEPVAFGALDKPLKDAALRLREGELSSVLKLADKRYAIVLAVDMTRYRNGARAFKSGDFKNAKMNLLKHVELNPDAVKARILLGRIAEAANETKEAEMNYKEALRFDAGREEAYLRLGELYLHMGEFQQAKDLYEEGLYHIPGSKPLMTGLKKTKGRLVAAGNDRPKREDREAPAERKSSEVVEKSTEAPKTDKPGEEMTIAVSPKDRPSNNVTSTAKSEKLEEATDTQEAAKPKEEIPAAVSSEDGLSNNAASTNKKEKKMQIRIIFTDKESDARDILSEVRKGKSFAILAKEKSVDEKTREEYGYLGEVSLESLHASIQKALSDMSEGQISEVIKIDQSRYAVIHVTETSLYKEAERAFIAGDHATAETKLLKYVESNPDAVKARTILGKIYEDRNEPSKAIAMYREALSFSPKTVLIYERLARVYLFLGMYVNARNVYVQGLKQMPSSPELEEGIEIANMLMIGEGERMP